MTEERLNNVLLLNVHREEAANRDLKEIACMFVASSQQKNICLWQLCVTTLMDNLCTMVQFLLYNLNFVSFL